MPIYEYRCSRCEAEFEVSRPISRMNEAVSCPTDGADATRMLSAPTLIGSSKRERSPGTSAPAGDGAGTGGGGWSHFGHSHGPGSGGHSHPH